MKREVLDRPFPADLIKQRRGAGGKSLSYVEGAEYIRRLNEAFEGLWSFEVVSFEVGKGDVIVQGRLTAAGLTKEQFGGHARKEKEEVGDALKSAATDALKKCATLLGVGLHLYSDAPAERPKERERPPKRPKERPKERPVTAEDLQEEVMSVARERGISIGSIDMASRRRYGRCLEELDVDQLGKVLAGLNARGNAA